MVMGVGFRQILLTQINSLTLKPRILCKNWGHISTSQVIANLLPR